MVTQRNSPLPGRDTAEHRKQFESYYEAFDGARDRFEQYKKSGVLPFVYFFFYRRKLGLILEKLLGRLANKPDCRVLDAGCGTGDFLATLRRRYSQPLIVGVDISFIQVRKTIENVVPSGSFGCCQCFGEYLPFADGVYDCAVSADVIEHAVDKKQHIQELMRVLKTGGRLVITTDNPNSGKPEADQNCHSVTLNGEEYLLKDSWIGIRQLKRIVGEHDRVVDHGYYRLDNKLVRLVGRLANCMPLGVCALVGRAMVLFEKAVLVFLPEKDQARTCLFEYLVIEKT